MRTVTLFSFGYRGWGSSTDQLVDVVDAVEGRRGYAPPIFVDVRFNRSAQAKGFANAKFQNSLDPGRYRWMREMGNRRYNAKRAPHIEIAKPSAADDLLFLALAASWERRRLIFFCQCPFPAWEGRTKCHRHRVGSLVLAAARRYGVVARVVEWPGGSPQHLDLEVAKPVYDRIMGDAAYIPVSRRSDRAALGALAWASSVTVRCGKHRLHRLIGPLIHRDGAWKLPIVDCRFEDGEGTLDDYKAEQAAERRFHGWELRRSDG